MCLFTLSVHAGEVSLPEGNFYQPGEYLRVLVKGPMKLSVGSFETIVNSTDQQLVPVLIVGDGEKELKWPGGSVELRPTADQGKRFWLVQPELYESMPVGEVAGVRWRVALHAGIYAILIIGVIIASKLAAKRGLVVAVLAAIGLIALWRRSLPAEIVTRRGNVTYVVPRAGHTAEFPWDEKVFPVFSSENQAMQLDWDNRKFKFAQPTVFVRRF